MNLGDPYRRFEGKNFQANFASWPKPFDQEVFREIIGRVKPKTIIEVGTFLGYSISQMLEACDSEGLGTTAICIDTWLGGADHYIHRDEKTDDLFFQFFNMKDGISKLFDQFCINMVVRGYHKRVTAFANTSDNAYEYLKYKGIKADLIYIDAAHLKEPVRRDMEHYKELLTENGTLFGHDINWSEVQMAVSEFCQENSMTYVTYHNKFWEVKKCK